MVLSAEVSPREDKNMPNLDVVVLNCFGENMKSYLYFYYFCIISQH